MWYEYYWRFLCIDSLYRQYSPEGENTTFTHIHSCIHSFSCMCVRKPGAHACGTLLFQQRHFVEWQACSPWQVDSAAAFLIFFLGDLHIHVSCLLRLVSLILWISWNLFTSPSQYKDPDIPKVTRLTSSSLGPDSFTTVWSDHKAVLVIVVLPRRPAVWTS